MPPPQMARALYHRGVAYRKANKPAQAISDLTSALWLKNGLQDADRQDAVKQRADAYREAGLPDQSGEDGRPAGTGLANPVALLDNRGCAERLNQCSTRRNGVTRTRTRRTTGGHNGWSVRKSIRRLWQTGRSCGCRARTQSCRTDATGIIRMVV